MRRFSLLSITRFAWSLFAGPVTSLRLLIALCCGAGLAPPAQAADSRPPAPDFPPAHDATEAKRQDLAYLESVMNFDRSFTAATRAAFKDAVADLARRAPALDDAGFELGVTRAVALALNGHTNTRSITRGHHLNSLPVRFAWFAEGLFVVKALPEHAALLGSELLAEDSHTVADLARALRPYVGGADSLAQALLPNLLQSPAALHAAGLARSPKEITLRVRLHSGEVTESHLAALAEPSVPEERSDWPQRSLSPVPIPDDAHSWRHVLSPDTAAPLSLRHPDTPYWETWLEALEAVFVQINTTRTRGDLALDAYLARLLPEVKQRGVRHAVIDLRFNSGGNYQLTAEFSENLPSALSPDGKIFILTSPATFSAAIVTVARLKYFAGARGVIVGEPVGDHEQFWAEGETVLLPHSKIPVRYSNGYHDWENGPRSPIPQHGPNQRYGVAAGKLAPDLMAPWRLSDYLAGRDSALEAIHARLATGRAPRQPK